MQVRSRHHLRADDVRELEQTIAEQFGVDLSANQYELVELTDDTFDLVLVDNTPSICYIEDELSLTVRGANEFPPTKHVVTVDAGAVSFVSDGADIMRPGIVDADEDIKSGDIVIIVEETHGKALAIGRSRVSGTELIGDSGKVIDSVHFVGDDLYQLEI